VKDDITQQIVKFREERASKQLHMNGQMRQTRGMLIWMSLLSVYLLALTSCGPTQEQPSQSAQSSRREADQVAQAMGADSSKLSDHDFEVLVEMNVLSTRWNHAAAPLVRDYLDPNVQADSWVRSASAIIAEMRAVHMEMSAEVQSLEDEGLRKTLVEIVENYRAKLNALVVLHNAVASGDTESEQAAQVQLSTATQEGQRLAQALIERIRPLVDPAELEREARKRAEDISDRMRPR